MSNRAVHAGIGALAGLGAYTLFKWFRDETWTAEGAVASAAGGAAVACLPDILEPAVSPNHRSTFHSVAGLCGLGVLAHKVLSKPDASPDLKLILSVVTAAYSSHLGADAITPKGLPFLS